MAISTDLERIARLEGEIRHLATKVDLERVRADLSRQILIQILVLGGVNVAVVSAGIAFLKLTG